MIRINLLGEQVDRTGSYVLQGMVLGVAMIVTLGTCFVVQMNISDILEEAKKEKSNLEMKLAKLEKITKEVEGLEQKEQKLKEKLSTIATLKARKHGPVRILDELNNAIPERAWLTSIKEKSGQLEINGIALDNQTIATFMNTLTGSPYFGNADLVHSTQIIKDGIKLAQFSLLVKIEEALSVKAQAQQINNNVTVIDQQTENKVRNSVSTTGHETLNKVKQLSNI